MSGRKIPVFFYLTLISIVGSFAIAQAPLKPIDPQIVLEISEWPYAPATVALSKDGKGLSALSIGLDGRTYFKYWNLTNEKEISSGLITSDPIPNRGGCIAGDPESPRHSSISAATWNTMSSPVLDWVRGQAVDLQTKSQNAISSHPGWDAWESYAIKPGWSLSSLSVKSMNTSNPIDIRHWVEWNAPSAPLSLKLFIAWSQAKRKGFEAISENGKWIAFSSSLEPQPGIFEQPGPPKLVECPGYLRIWSVGTPLPIHCISMNQQVEMLEFSPEGSYLIVTPKGGMHEIWNTRSGILIGKIPRQTRRVEWGADEESFYLIDPSTGKATEIQTTTQQIKRKLVFAPPIEKQFSGFVLDAVNSRAVGWVVDGAEQDRWITKIFVFHIPTKTPN